MTDAYITRENKDMETVILGIDALVEGVDAINRTLAELKDTVSAIPIAIQIVNRRKE